MFFLFFTVWSFLGQDFVFAGPGTWKSFHQKAVCSSVKPSKFICHDLFAAPRNSHEIITIKKDGKNYKLVREELMTEKLTRYFSRTSNAVIAMSCCQGTQLHRRCLQTIYHADKNGCSDQCPKCLQQVTRSVFAQSNASYIIPDNRKKNCDACHTALGWRPVLKK